MKDELISFQTAVLAKEKGFNIPVNCYSNVVEPNRVIEVGAFNHNHKQPTTVSRPTQSLLQRWIRETYKIHIEIGWMRVNPFYPSRTNYYFAGIDFLNDRDRQGLTTLGDDHNTHEDALEDGLIMALNLIQE